MSITTAAVVTPSVDITGQRRLLVEVDGDLLGVIHPTPNRPDGGCFSWLSYANEDVPRMGIAKTEQGAISAILGALEGA